MHNMWTVYTLFITINIVSQSQQMRAKKKKVENVNWKTQTQSANAHYVIYVGPQFIFLWIKSPK